MIKSKISKFAFALLIGASACFAIQSDVHAAKKKRRSKVRQRITAIEERLSLDIFSFSGGMGLNYDSMEFTGEVDSGPGGVAEVKRKVHYMRMNGYLNADAEPYEDFQFYSRYAFSKFMNTIHPMGDDFLRNTSKSRAYTGSEVYVQKFYFDWMLTDSIIFSAGRLPTFDGSPQHFKTGDARMGTYPMLAYNAILDGMALSYNMGDADGLGSQLSLRMVYTPFNSPISRIEALASKPDASVIGTVENDGGDNNNSNDTYAFIVDYKNDNISAMLFYFHLAEVALNFPAELGMKSENRFTLDNLAFHFDIEDMFSTGLSLSTSYLMSTTHSMGLISVPAPSPPYPDGTYVPIGGHLTNDAEDTKVGTAVLVSLRYQLPVDAIKRPFIGVEYIIGDKYHNYYNIASADLDNMYAVQGNGMQIYYTQPLKDTMMWTIGYRQKNQLWGGANPSDPTIVNNSPYGERAELANPEVTTTIYSSLKVSF